MASSKKAEETTVTAAEETAAAEETTEKYYEVNLFKDSDRYKDPVFVGCNGRTYMVQRGVPVKVPACVYEILKNSENADKITEARLIQLSNMSE